MVAAGGAARTLPHPMISMPPLLATHDGLTRAESEALNARLILILANHIGDHAVLSQALHAALPPPAKRAPT